MTENFEKKSEKINVCIEEMDEQSYSMNHINIRTKESGEQLTIISQVT